MANVMKNKEKGKKGDETPRDEMWKRSRDKVHTAVRKLFGDLTKREEWILSLGVRAAWWEGIQDAMDSMRDMGKGEET